MAVHDSDIKSYTVTPEGFDLPRALRLLLLGNGAFEDVAYGAQLEEAFREVKRLDAGKKKHQKSTPRPSFSRRRRRPGLHREDRSPRGLIRE